MSYKTDQELPESVRDALPRHTIYRAAFSSAWGEYADARKRHIGEPREEAAHKVAWAAVKDKYKKDDRSGTRKAKS